jgi:nitrogen fixation protein
MAYTAPQIGTILLKADRTMYKIGQIAYENMFAEDNEALDYERDIIFIYKKAVEYADDLFLGTEKLDKVVERLAAKISAYDYGELNPIYANVSSILTSNIVAGSALNDLSDVTITNVQDNQILSYDALSGQWINIGVGSAVRNSQAFIATAGQTVFTTAYPFNSQLLDLYINGVKINSLSYTTFGEYQITLNDGCLDGDIVDVVIYDTTSSVLPSVNSLNDLIDVSIGALANNQVLYYNSTTGLWQNGAVGGGTWGSITGTLSNQTDLQNALNLKVPYTGATANVNLGEFGLTAGQLTLDTSPTGVAVVGTTRWNNATGTSETTLKGGNVLLRNGVDLVARVVNKVTPNTTLTKASYQAVRVTGAQGQRLAVAYAQANNDANSADTIGLVCETIPTNQEGFIMAVGQLENINTTGSLQGEVWVDGDVLYLSPFTPGAITKVKPIGNGHIIVIGYVEYAHQNNGKIYVKVMNGWELDELHDVSITTPLNNDALIYETSTGLWKNKSISTAIGYTPVGGSGVSGQIAYWNGTSTQTGNNSLFWDATNSRLGIGTNAPSQILNVSKNQNSSTQILVQNTDVTNTSSRATFQATNGAVSARLDTIGASGAYLGAFLGTITNHRLYFWTNGQERGYFGETGNLVLGIISTTDSGERLQVTGTMKVTGVIYGISGIVVGTTGSGGIISASSTNAANLRFSINGSSLLGAYGAGIQNSAFLFNYPTSTNTDAATHSLWGILHTFAPVGGTTGYIMAGLQPTINQTGGANGITRGLYVNPTLTAAADWRSIEWSNNTGWGLYGTGTANNYLGGKLLINTTTTTNTEYLTVGGNVLLRPTGAAGVFSETSLNFYAASDSGNGVKLFTTDNSGYGIGLGISTRDGVTVSEKFRIFRNGNLVLQNGGTYTDGGQRLQVQGDAFIKGSGNTTATTALTVQNSTGLNILTVSNYGATTIRGGTAFDGDNAINILNGNAASIFNIWNSGRVFINRVGTIASLNIGQTIIEETSSGGIVTFGLRPATNFTTSSPFSGYSVNFTNPQSITSSGGETFHVNITATLAPTSGGSPYTSLRLNPTINQTGGANGITRGLYVNPTLTLAADFRAIETSAGNVLFGTGFFWNNTQNRLGIGIQTPSAALDILGADNVLAKIKSSTNTGSVSYVTYNNVDSSFEFGMYGSTRTAFGMIGSNSAYMYGIVDLNIASLTNIKFGTDSGGSPTERMRIFTNGNVGINTGATDGGQRFQVQGTTLLNGNVTFSSSTGMFWDATNSRLGIGTNAPSSTLDIRGKARIQASGNCELDFADGSAAARIAVTSTVGYVGTLTSHPFAFFSAATERARFFAGGNLAIGSTTDSGERLQVNGTMKVTGESSYGGNKNVSDNFVFVLNRTVSNPAVSPRLRWTGVNVISGNPIDVYGEQNALVVSAISGINTVTVNVNFVNFGSQVGSAAAPLLRAGNGYTGGIYFIGGGGVVGNAGIGFSIGNYAEGMRLNSAGNLLIGSVTDTTERLQVTGTMKVTGASSFADITATSYTFGGLNMISSGTGTGEGNVAVGRSNLRALTAGAYNTAIGYVTMNGATTGSFNVAIGANTLQSLSSGTHNMAIGQNAINFLSTGSNNVGIGWRSLYRIAGASNNVAIGYNSANTAADSSNMVANNNSVFIGHSAKASTDGNTNEVVIGYDASGNGSNTCTIGNTSITKTFLRGTINVANLPTSATGLIAGDLWNNAGVINIV